ncbi:hypothetical protein H6G06_21275 [Anabaena sphaerica FACHB-251]|uniref:Uncharacterized protein n=1 Tax=Anabaena sphaerica FACHB-251 TaxID=2692883 RepID=A0A926WKU5_9NOST|nr:hypothetical protein [Anabaena sphaerica]MBD2295937.1 hypothetical protein [Anabaena sphaerica FACHB-251]
MFNLQRIFTGFVLKSLYIIYQITHLFVEIKYCFRKRAALTKSQEILDWVKTQNIPLDTSEALKLPDHLLGITHDDLVQVLHTSEDRYYIAIMINYSSGITGTTHKVKGIFVCDAPLAPRYLTKIPNVCHRINILGEYQKPYKVAWAFTNLEVEKQYNDCLFAVYRQLN